VLPALAVIRLAVVLAVGVARFLFLGEPTAFDEEIVSGGTEAGNVAAVLFAGGSLLVVMTVRNGGGTKE